ncbi:MAG: nuclear transport factor 2 family protein [Proteobacteria bacterium]|nr:nuclear transport factor 2 family protein [Pseudomonadota bacterium]
MNDSALLKQVMSRLEELEARVRRVDDVQEICKLKARYCLNNDGGWPEQGPSHSGPALDDFAEDAVWDGTPFLPVTRGREAIRRTQQEHQAVPFVMHCVMNPIIEVQGDTATGRWSCIIPITSAEGEDRVLLGTYDERYVRTPQGWKYSYIKFTAARAAPKAGGWGAPVGA